MGSAQRCGVISLTLWLFGRKIETNRKKKINKCDKRLGGQESSPAASRRIRPLDYGRLLERSPGFTHAISPSPPGGLGRGDDASTAAQSQHEVTLAGRCDWTAEGKFSQNLMTFPDDLPHLRCARVGDSYTCWIYLTCPLERSWKEDTLRVLMSGNRL